MRSHLILLATLSNTAALQATRRRAIHAASAAAASVVLPRAPASAFANAVPEAAKYADRKKRKGPAPQNLGLKNREADGADVETPELRLCGAAPNCFSTTPDSFSAERTIAPWKAPSGKDRAALVSDVDAVIKSYQPGQNGIDGGGFEIDKASKDGYFLVRYESLKNGYIDDVELALSDNAPYVLRVRSSSRVGFLDFNVNAKRLNRLAADLRARGWAVPEISAKTHPDYFAQNAGR